MSDKPSNMPQSENESLTAPIVKAIAVGVATFGALFTSDLSLLKDDSGIKDAVISAIDGIIAAVITLALQMAGRLNASS